MSRQVSSRKAATGRGLPYPFIVMVTDRRLYGSAVSGEGARFASLMAAVEASARAGIDAVQIREGGLEDAETFFNLVKTYGRANTKIVITD